ncbi:MAG: ComF family protein [Elusimicrobia bacterium]|nr:ComF family protein [Elusimicrobiota bacterium]
MNFLFPPLCPGCEVYLGIKADPARLCPDCAAGLAAVAREHLFRETGRAGLEVLYSLGPYGTEPLTRLIHKIKYEQKDWIVDALIPALRDFLAKARLQDAVDAVVPVPLHPRRLRSRGFNQAELIGRAVGEILGKPVYGDVLKRLKSTRPQMSLAQSQRRKENVKGAFGPAGRTLNPDQRVLLVDDVATTGATLQECGRVLGGMGVKKIIGFALAA